MTDAAGQHATALRAAAAPSSRAAHPCGQRLQQQLAANLLQRLQAVLEQLELAVHEREAHRHGDLCLRRTAEPPNRTSRAAVASRSVWTALRLAPPVINQVSPSEAMPVTAAAWDHTTGESLARFKPGQLPEVVS